MTTHGDDVMTVHHDDATRTAHDEAHDEARDGAGAAARTTTTYRFRLYVLGGTARSRAAEEQLRALCRERLGDRWKVDVVDVKGRPDLAEAARIVATPTLDRLEPEPPTRVIGDLSSADQLAAALDLPTRPPMPREG